MCVGLLALLAARFINWAIYSWAYNRRELGPWSRPTAKSSQRTWFDHLPVLGWLRLRREGKLHGRWYWVRPLVIELIFPVALAWYYHFYVSGGALPNRAAVLALQPQMHWQFVGHFVLFALMAIATFIDFDEQSIPDYVTIPGTIIGIVGAAIAPAWLPFNATRLGVSELNAATPAAWPVWLNGGWGLAIALTILCVWGFALLERRVVLRRGVVKGIQYFFARMFRHPLLWKIVAGVTAGLMLFVAVCWQQQLARWEFLLSSLLGLAFAGGVTWGVRLSASYGLGVEALGFGDVTLMAMIGTYVGWQPSLLIFFIAPLVAILFVIVRTLITGDSSTPYGPYLCAAAVLLLVYWDALWTGWAAPVFELGTLILGIVVACVFMMGALLWIWRLIKQGLGIGG